MGHGLYGDYIGAEQMRNYLNSALVALQFLTQVPVKFKQYPDEKIAAGSLIFYPAVGLLIGYLLVLAANLFSAVPPMLSAAMLLSIWVAITGALHMDGLADSCDAWMGGQGDRQLTLEIMKDPCSGPIAVVSLICLLLLKFTALLAILELQQYYLLLLAPLISRSMLPILLLNTPYVRPTGIGASLVANAPEKPVYVAAVLGLVVAYAVGSLTVLIIGALSYLALRMLMMKRLAGLTGDTAGASIELVETLVLLSVVISIY
ncbi:MAG: adenosylcobinamide-GDP ribazoletransferase [Pseudomonadales bacterium]|nr:adenosylcobinamide-GDP ribazoletransferase [Pseudomonadales bacterium]